MHRRRRGDAGMTLVEMVIGITISAFIMGSIGMSMVVLLKSDKPTSARLTEARDVAFLQTYLPVDYSSAISRNVDPTAQPVAGQTLPGTNVLSLVREEKTVSGTIDTIISYRYEKVGLDWQLVRYEWGNPDYPGQLRRSVVAHQLADPPVGWTPGSSVDHAVVVHARNQTVARPVGDDMQIFFKTGNSFTTGGSGLASNSELPTDYSGSISDPTAVRSRCGGRVSLILDVSGSITSVANGTANVKSAATGFIDAFTGTPSEIGVIKFSTAASTVYPASYGTYFSVVDKGSAQITAAKAAINSMPFGGSTNWEDPLYLTTRNNAGTPYTNLPELIVLVTDGDPNLIRNAPWNWGYLSSAYQMSTATSAAATAANYARERNGRVIGILIGDAVHNTASVDRLKQVVGKNAWSGTSSTDVGNASTADYFLPPGGDFSKLGGVLKAVVAGQCGGTVTVQKKIDQGGGVLVDPTQPWSYSTDVGVKTLNPATDVAVTFDYTFADGEGTKEATVIEQPASGYVFDRVECSSGGISLGSDRVKDAPDDGTGVVITLKPNEAVSCTYISKVSP